VAGILCTGLLNAFYTKAIEGSGKLEQLRVRSAEGGIGEV